MRISVFVFSVMRDSYHAGGGKHHMGNCCSFWLLMPQRKMYIYDSGAEPGSQPGSCKTQSKLNIWVQYLVLFLIYGWNVRSQQRREVTDKSKVLGDGNKWITPKLLQVRVRSVSDPPWQRYVKSTVRLIFQLVKPFVNIILWLHLIGWSQSVIDRWFNQCSFCDTEQFVM